MVNSDMASVVHKSWSFCVSTCHMPCRLVFSSCLNMWFFSFTPKMVNSWKSSISTVTAAATMNQALGVLPMPLVIGSQPIMMANIPMLAQILAKAPIFSLTFCSTVSEGSIDQ